MLDRSGLECISDFPGVGWHVLFDFNHVAVLRFGTAKRSIHGFCQTRSDPAPPASENTSSSSVDCSIPRGASPGKQSNTSAQVLNQIMGPISREPSKKRVHEEPDWGLLKVQQREEARMRREQVSPSIVEPTQRQKELVKKGLVRRRREPRPAPPDESSDGAVERDFFQKMMKMSRRAARRGKKTTSPLSSARDGCRRRRPRKPRGLINLRTGLRLGQRDWCEI